MLLGGDLAEICNVFNQFYCAVTGSHPCSSGMILSLSFYSLTVFLESTTILLVTSKHFAHLLPDDCDAELIAGKFISVGSDVTGVT